MKRLRMSCLAVAAVVAALAVWAEPAVGQRLAPRAAPVTSHALVIGDRPFLEGGNFLLEAAAGTLGSLAGIAVVGLVADCGVEDLGCIIRTVGAGGAMGAIGATAGVTIAARRSNAPRSVAGAALGAVVGTGVGLGVHWLLNRSSDRNLGDAVVVPIFVISQGVFAAVGSRTLAR